MSEQESERVDVLQVAENEWKGGRINRKEVEEIGCCASNCYIYSQYPRKSSTREDLIHINILFILALVNRDFGKEKLDYSNSTFKECATAAAAHGEFNNLIIIRFCRTQQMSLKISL